MKTGTAKFTVYEAETRLSAMPDIGEPPTAWRAVIGDIHGKLAQARSECLRVTGVFGYLTEQLAREAAERDRGRIAVADYRIIKQTFEVARETVYEHLFEQTAANEGKPS